MKNKEAYETGVMTRERIGWQWWPLMFGWRRLYYDGPLLVFWLGFAYLDLSYTKLAYQTMHKDFKNGKTKSS